MGITMTSVDAAAAKASKGVAVVTGASSGIGMVYAERLARRGYDLILIARRKDRLEAVAERLRTAHAVSADVVVADLARPDDLERALTIVGGNSRITMLVNNAGAARFIPFANTNASDIDLTLDVNAKAATHLSRTVLARFKANDHGTIVNIGSMLSFFFLSINCAYSGTKGYLMNFTRGLQDEVAGSNVAVQLVIPAVVATEIWEKGGFPLSALDPETIMTAEDCVDAALAGLDRGEKITFPSLEDDKLWADFEAARMKLLAATQTKVPASRYRSAK
jgi:uncharacterized protein